jgi:hypothetical protein
MINFKFDRSKELFEVVVVENFTREFVYGRGNAEKVKKYLHTILDNVTIEINHLTSQIVTGVEEVA